MTKERQKRKRGESEQAALRYEQISGREEYRVVGLKTPTVEEVRISPVYNGLPVTEIGRQAFERTGLISVTLPRSVRVLDSWAFSECKQLRHVFYEGSVEDWCAIRFENGANPLRNGAFLYVDGRVLTEITFSHSLTAIGRFAFEGCKGLQSVTFGTGLRSVGSWSFFDCGELAYVEMGTATESIGYGAFQGCRALKEIAIADGVTAIGGYAFCECTNLESASISENVSSLGTGLFRDCEKLTSLVFLGTEKRWEALPKYDEWRANTEIKTVVCKDKRVTLE